LRPSSHIYDVFSMNINELLLVLVGFSEIRVVASPFIFETNLISGTETVIFPEAFINLSFCKQFRHLGLGQEYGHLLTDLNGTECMLQL
jgi:hypothetical protein